MASNPASVTASDRLTFTVFLAVAFHGILIFGVSFAPELQRAAPHTLEVTLAQHRSDSEPEEADFIAQSNQEGSGDQADKQELTTTEQADFADSKLENVQLKEKTTLERRERVSQQLVITTARDSEHKVNADQKEKTEPKPLKVAKQENLQDLSQQIASLQARLDEQNKPMPSARGYGGSPLCPPRRTSKRSTSMAFVARWKTWVPATSPPGP